MLVLISLAEEEESDIFCAEDDMLLEERASDGLVVSEKDFILDDT